MRHRLDGQEQQGGVIKFLHNTDSWNKNKKRKQKE